MSWNWLRRTAAVVSVATIVLSGSSHQVASAAITPNPDGSSWASGSFKTYVSDGGPVDSTVNYYVHYWPKPNGTAKVDYILMVESPPRGGSYHTWIRYCYARTCKSTYQFLTSSQYTWVEPGWTVRLGADVQVKVTNSWDPTGYWGETWTGAITLPR